MTNNNIEIKKLGLIDYDSAMKIQAAEREKVARHGGGTILFLEHYPVITLGRNASAGSILFPIDELETRGFALRRTDRGGDATVHEPGQLVAYFILPVESKAAGPFVANIMELIAGSLRDDFSLDTSFDQRIPGLSISGRKICSAGFDLRGGVSSHGIALNVSNTLEGFSLIAPCGMKDMVMTTMSRELGRRVDAAEAIEKLSSRLRNCTP